MITRRTPPNLKHQWTCTELGRDVFQRSRFNPLPEGELVAHIRLQALINGEVVDRPLPVSPSHYTYRRHELDEMIATGKDHIGLPLHGTFAAAVKDAVKKFEELDAVKAAVEKPTDPVQHFQFVEKPKPAVNDSAEIMAGVPAQLAMVARL